MKWLLVFLLLSLLFLGRKENFTPEYHEALSLYHDSISDPVGWRQKNNNTITTTISVKALRGSMDYENIIGRPQLGFPNKEFGYSNWSQLQGTNAWFALDESTGGDGWMWWRLTDRWKKWPEERKHRELQIEILLTARGNTPTFPIGYSLTIPDWSFGRSVRFWLVFTFNPVDEFSFSEQKQTISKAPPLIIRHSKHILNPKTWTLEANDQLIGIVSIDALQGEFDLNQVASKQGWLSWELNSKLSNPDQLFLTMKIFPDKKRIFPYRQNLFLKDLHRERWIEVEFVIPKNPYQIYKIDSTWPKIKPKKQHLGLRCHCQLPVLLNGLCQQNNISLPKNH